MKKFGTKQLVPVLTAIMGIVFAYVGFFELGFWDTTLCRDSSQALSRL